MNRWKILVLCMIMGLMIVPAVLAEKEYAVNSDTEDTFAFARKYYLVNPWTESSSDTEDSAFSIPSK